MTDFIPMRVLNSIVRYRSVSVRKPIRFLARSNLPVLDAPRVKQLIAKGYKHCKKHKLFHRGGCPRCEQLGKREKVLDVLGGL